MSNDYYNNSTNTLTTGEIARSTDVEGKFAEVVSGFALLPGEEELKRETTNFVDLAGSANTYTAAMTYTPTSYVDGMHIVARVNATNTGASTINVDSLGAKSIKRIDGSALTAGDLTDGQIVELRYDGDEDYFVLQNAVALSSTNADTVDGLHATSFAYRSNNLSDLANAGTARTNLGLGGAILGDTMDGRKLKCAKFWVEQGATPGTNINVHWDNVFNADTVAEGTNIAAEGSSGSWSLDAGATVITLAYSGLSGEVVAVIASGVIICDTAAAYWLHAYVSASNIVLTIYALDGASPTSWLTAVGSGKRIYGQIIYITSG